MARDRHRNWPALVVALLVLGDLAALAVASYITAPEPVQLGRHPWFWVFAVALLSTLALGGRYHPDGARSRVDETLQVARITAVLTALLILVDAIVVTSLPLTARQVLFLGLLFGGFSIVYRWLLRSLQKYLFRYGLGTRRVVLVGHTSRTGEVCEQIQRHPRLGYEVLGIVADPVPAGESMPAPRLGATGELAEIIRERQVDEIIITLEKPDHEALLGLLSQVSAARVKIKILPDMYEVVSGMARTEHIYGLPLIRINPELITPFGAALKRGMDLVIAGPLLLLSVPFMLLIGLLIRLGSPGPALLVQERVGYRGRTFRMAKFRTMVADAEEGSGPVWAREDDPRVTPVGRFLRRTRLDELPQLWNVLRGEMSLVGPRPERPPLVAWLAGEFPFYHRRLQVRPGITGWAQVRGNYDTSLEDVRRKLKDDFFYIENRSLRLDVKILLMTLVVVLRGEGF